MTSHSELTAAWRRILDSVTLLAERYRELHRAMREFLVLFAERGIDTNVDVQAMHFVDRMVAAVHECLYGVLDPLQAPKHIFGQLRRFLHTAAIYVDLTPAIQQYFETLKEAGETEFTSPLEQQKQIVSATAQADVSADLGVEVRSVVQRLNALHQLERALEGKYIDFRVSTALDAMNFVFDRGGSTLYKAVVAHSRVTGLGDERTIYFSQLRLEGREKYRVILVGERGATFEAGTRIPIEIAINESSGFRRQPVRLSYDVSDREQRNFEFDFDAPDIQTITDLRIGVPAHLPIRTAMLFMRHRFFAARAAEPPKPVQSTRTPPEPPPPPAPPPDPRLDEPPSPPPWQNPPRRRRIEPV
jgi:hypothetical protein